MAKPKSKKSNEPKKRGGSRPNAGRKSKAEKAADLAARGVLTPQEPPEPEPRKPGRPTEYKPEYAEQARKLCQLGATDRELADFFNVEAPTIWRWAHRYDEFCSALKAGKDACDDRVERSLYNRAVGYSFDAVKIFMPKGAPAPVYAPYVEHVPPETGAAALWLTNRRRDSWRNKQQHEHTGADGAALVPVINVTIGSTEPSPA
jgi:hypothetical protein